MADFGDMTSHAVLVTKSADFYPYSPLQHIGFAVVFGLPSLAFVVVSLRVYIRLSIKQWGLDDTLILVAMLILIAESGAGYMAMRAAYFGVHSSDIPKDKDPKTQLIWNYIAQLLYNPVLSIVKTSVLVFLLRIGVQKNATRLSIHALNAFNISMAVAIFVVVIFQCNPIAFFWDKSLPGGGVCIATTTFYAWTAGLTILTDVLVLALPFWIFLGLNMATRLKVAIIGIFLLGGMVTVISCLRLQWIIERIPPAQANPDPTYDIRYTYVFAESSLAIVAASAPAMRSLLGVWFPHAFSSDRSTSNSDVPVNPWGFSLSNSTQRGRGGIALRNLEPRPSKGRAPIRSQTPTPSEEEIMTYDGIKRTNGVNDMCKECPPDEWHREQENEAGETH